jgi:hypothetical protein
LGVIHIMFFLILYVAIPSKLTGFSYIFAIIVLNFGFSIYQGIQYRKEIGGFMSYGAAFKYVFVLMSVNGFVGFIFTMIFVMVVPDFPQQMADSQLDTSIYWAQKFGAPESSLDEVREKFNPEDVTERFTIVGQLMGFGIGLIFYAIVAAISGLFVRKNQPETF